MSIFVYRRVVRLWVAVVLLPSSVGCVSTEVRAVHGFVPPDKPYRILVMPVDAVVGQHDALTRFVPNDDWSRQARGEIQSAIVLRQSGAGADPAIAESSESLGIPAEQLVELVRLHHAIAQAIVEQEQAHSRLPAKAGELDWTFGDVAIHIGQYTGIDYALFVRAEDAFATTGHMAVQATGYLTCFAIGVCILPQTPEQRAYASIVDLRTGKVVWFNRTLAGHGDIRAQHGARRTIWKLLSGIDDVAGDDDAD